MSWASSEAVGVLTFLLPGFLAGTSFYSLTSYPKPGVFGRIIHALSFTVVGQALTALLLLSDSTIDEPVRRNDGYDFLFSICVSVALALICVYIMNNDTLHSVLRRIGVTKETSYPSEWYSTFTRHPDCYVILHLDGQRRLYGWPEEWPSDPNEGHFRMAETEWLTDDVADANGLAGTDVSAILVTRDSGGNGGISEHENGRKAKGVDDGKGTDASALEKAAGNQIRGSRSISETPNRRETETAAGAAAEKARLASGTPVRMRRLTVRPGLCEGRRTPVRWGRSRWSKR